MKHALIYGFLVCMLVIGITTTTPAHAETATSTATSTVVTATTTATTTTTTATTTATTTPVVSTTTPTTISHIADLLAQLAKLTAIFNDLKAKLFGVQSQIADIKADLREGVQGEDVKSIQELLASDPSIYPAGLKTGYFGPLTVEAIKRFQAKNGLEVTGTINTETKAALDTLMAQRRSEGHFPFGLLIAPGQHRAEFEHRLRSWCGVATSTVSVSTSTTNVTCVPLVKKYHFEKEKNGTSTISWPNMMKEEHGKGKDMSKGHGNASSTDDESDDDGEDDDDN